MWSLGSRVCSPAQMAESLCPPFLPVPGMRQEFPLCGWMEEPSGMSAPCLLNACLVSSCLELGPLCKRGKGD